MAVISRPSASGTMLTYVLSSNRSVTLWPNSSHIEKFNENINPGDILDYTFEFDSGFFATGESIRFAKVYASPWDTIKISGPLVSGFNIVVWVMNGTEDVDYRLTCAITTNQGRVFNRSVVLTCTEI